ncbi:ankyrin repeat domain-containing protein [Microlunatus speluncae]|uniref:ankyrin repeat domain-containing protein n=1 Tax=Microlunatus speluncae TaxID=2594267 RepID=UPI0012667D5A|nr:ankyrin repeat domain-containing protein [Microlunatus speluncae]
MRATVIVVAVAVACLISGCGAVTEDPRDVFTGDRTVELARAVTAGDRARIDDLIDRDADVDDRGTDGTSLLQWAVDSRSLTGLEALLDHDADPEQEGRKDEPAPYYAAAWEPDRRFLQALLDAGADPDVRYRETGSTPIFTAALHGHRDNVQTLLDAGADPNVIDRLGENPLFNPARANQGGILLQLLRAEADPRLENPRGDTFQDYYFGFQANVLNDRARAERKEIIDWLEDHDVPVVADADQFR